MWTSHREDQTDDQWSPTDFVPLEPLHAGSGGPGIVEETDEGVDDADVLNMAFSCGKE